MTDTEKLLLDSINDMAEQAPSVGLCAAPFRVMHTMTWEIISERDKLLVYRLPQIAEGGRCPTCGTFADPYANYCWKCGQRIEPEDNGINL